MRTVRFLVSAALGFLAANPGNADQVVFSEIHYHPRGAAPEFIEVYNQTATPFDIARWRLTGGVRYEFPEFSEARSNLTFLRPFERIVLSGADEATTRSVYGIASGTRVYGPWVGDLDDAGERVTLEDRNGVALCTVEYSDRGRWPVAADGAGHSLELKDPNRVVDDADNWQVSERPGGSPGYVPAAEAETLVPNPELGLQGVTTVLLDYDTLWRFYDSAEAVATAWRDRDFDDSSWGQGQALLGFEEAALPSPGIRTPLQDADQITYYFRGEFSYDGPLDGAVLRLDQVLDDGAVYYLNGRFIGLSRMSTNSPTATTTASNVGNAVEEKDPFPTASGYLETGRNVLAVEVHQSGTNSSDLVFGARLEVTVPEPAAIQINELLPGEAGASFIEFYNPGGTAIDLQGYYLTDDPAQPTRFRIDAPLPLPAQGLGSIGYAESGLQLTNPVTVYLVGPDGTSVVNALQAVIPQDGRSLGRKPVGANSWYLFTSPTRDQPNRSASLRTTALRLNEFQIGSSNAVSWVELFNPDSAPAALEGLFLSSHRRFANAAPLAGTVPAHAASSVTVSFPLVDDEVTLFLTDGSGVVLDARQFQRVPGRDVYQAWPDGGNEWYAVTDSTRDRLNDAPPVANVIINEILFDPPSDQRDGEFVELFNLGLIEADLSGWRFADGPEFVFPAGTRLAAGGYLVVAANAAHLRAAHGDIPVVGDFARRLDNRGERVRLVDAVGNLVDEVDYRVGGDWPDLTQGNGTSLELVNPRMDNALPSAWRDSDESTRAPFQPYSCTNVYQQLRTFGGTADYRELHLHLVGDGYVILQNIALRKDGVETNLIVNGDRESPNTSGASGWVIQGTHWASFVTNGQLHLISDGHGDNRANRVEIDVPGLVKNDNLVLSFEARWVYGTPRLIAQTWDHSVGDAFRLRIPETLGTPGGQNSRYRAAPPPQVDELRHSPAVPKPGTKVRVTARIRSVAPVTGVELVHRLDNANANGIWTAKTMYDNGADGGDTMAGDGVYSAELTEYSADGQVAQFYVRATALNDAVAQLPKGGAARPALFVVDATAVPDDLRTVRFVVSAYDRGALNGGETSKYRYRFPRLSNHYFNATFIHNERDVYYNAEVRNSGSPWTRATDLSRGKWKLPGDRRFRGHEKFSFDDDPTQGRRHNNRMTRYWLYLLGHPVNENEFVRILINGDTYRLREDTEPVANDFLDRNFENGSSGELYRIDDEWWFADNWDRGYRDADWSYKNTESAIRYHTEWMRRTLEDDYDYSALINLFFTISRTTYTQEQIERLLDAEAMLKMAAVRGYIYDWDWITLDRGKNGYLYRRWSDGRFQFLQWDSDLAFQNASGALVSGRAGVSTWLAKPYNRRRFYHYVSQLLDRYTQGSARVAAWLQCEEDANQSFPVDAAFYRSWFVNRNAFCRSQMGANYTRPLEVTTNSVDGDMLTLGGLAPFAALDIAVDGHPEAVCTWNPLLLNAWTVSGLTLRQGVNVLRVRGLNERGEIEREIAYTYTNNANGLPVVAMTAAPASWNVAVEQGLEIDARDSYDPEGTALQFAWVPPQALATFQGGTNGVATATFARPGLYAFTAVATDADQVTNTLTREAAVYGPGGFSAFDDVRLEAFWTLENVGYRTNSVLGPWLSPAEFPGALTVQLTPGVPTPVTSQGSGYPRVRRSLPSRGDWVFQTRCALSTRQFGDFLAGLEVELAAAAGGVRYVWGCEDGTQLSVWRATGAGEATLLAAPAWGAGEAILRIRRHGDQLHFERRSEEVWESILTETLAAGTLATAGSLVLGSDTAQTVQVRFDYALLVDPANTTELRRNLRLSEIMYNPVGGDAFEFVELVNAGATTLDLEGVQFVEGISYRFPTFLLGPGERVVVAKDPITLATRFDAAALRLAPDAYTGRLDNGGERLTLADAATNVILSFAYGDSGDWPRRADGAGASLEIIDPRADPADANNWNGSAEYHGSPGWTGIGKVASVVINEVLSHADDPYEDALELFNPTSDAVDVSGWYLSDDVANIRKFRFPAGCSVPAGGYLVVYYAQLTNTLAGAIVPFQFDSAHGDEAWLIAADATGEPTFFVDHVEFGAAERHVTWGRHPNGTGALEPMDGMTLGVNAPATLDEFRQGQGGPNAAPRVSPVVFSRILYDAPPFADEYLELQNRTSQPVPLFDPLHPTNTWSLANAVSFAFPPGIILAPQETVLVVPIDPEVFRARYGIAADQKILGPYVGALDNGGESLELYRPDAPETQPPEVGYVPQLRVERVRYNNRTPWPPLAAGAGAALLRRDPAAFADDPTNWYTDLDGDGLPDDWEIGYRLSPYYAADAFADYDGDGWTTGEEYRYGSNPLDPDDSLRLRLPQSGASGFVFEFPTLSGWAYDVWAADDPASGPWLLLLSVPAEDTARIITVTDPAAATGTTRFYRVISSGPPDY